MTLARKLLAPLLACGLAAVAAAAATWSTFSSTTASPASSFSAGTVAIADNDAGSTLSVPAMSPGTSNSGCIRVTYSGSLPASVRLYASSTGSLAPYLNLTVTRGTQAAPSFPSCTGFSADPTDYVGAGAGVVFTGTLSGFVAGHADFASGLADAPGSPQTWSANSAHSYMFSLSLPAAAPAAAQGLSSTATFTWEARNQ
jgi:hypothetical protein